MGAFYSQRRDSPNCVGLRSQRFGITCLAIFHLSGVEDERFGPLGDPNKLVKAVMAQVSDLFVDQLSGEILANSVKDVTPEDNEDVIPGT